MIDVTESDSLCIGLYSVQNHDSDNTSTHRLECIHAVPRRSIVERNGLSPIYHLHLFLSIHCYSHNIQYPITNPSSHTCYNSSSKSVHTAKTSAKPTLTTTQTETKKRKTHLKQQPRNRYKHNTNKSKRTTRPRNTQIAIHRRRKKREPRAETRTHQVIAGQHAGGVIGVGVGEVVQHAVEEEEGTGAEPCRADYGHYPVDGRAGGPAEPEEAALIRRRVISIFI